MTEQRKALIRFLELHLVQKPNELNGVNLDDEIALLVEELKEKQLMETVQAAIRESCNEL